MGKNKVKNRVKVSSKVKDELDRIEDEEDNETEEESYLNKSLYYGICPECGGKLITKGFFLPKWICTECDFRYKC